MGNLLNGVSFKEPTTVEDCDSTWDTDSEGEVEDEEEGDAPAQEDTENTQEHCGESDAGELADLPSAAEVKASDRPEEIQSPDTQQSDSNVSEQNIKPKRSFYAARDLYKYRHQYPNFKDLRCQNEMCNLRFYLNKIPFKPDGVYIEEILNKWKGDYEKLEHNHTYIQWLFPLREQGLNFYAKELTSYEIEEFKKTKEAVKRFIVAYKMMLDFFGIKLMDKSGKVSRATNWQERFQHLNESQHNYLRITRILKSLGELGYENFKYPLVKILLQESVVKNTIPNMKQSALEYFVYTIKDKRERRKLLRFAHRHYQPTDHFIWGPPKKQKVEETKAIKKTTPPTRSQKKHSSIEKKSRDTKCSNLADSPKGQHTADKETELAQKESKSTELKSQGSPVKETKSSNGETMETLVSNLQPEEEKDTCTTSENEIKHSSDNVNKKCGIEEIIIVESLDVGSTDCLCSLSPITPNTGDSVASSGGTDADLHVEKTKDNILN